jgi:hypothetical protein
MKNIIRLFILSLAAMSVFCGLLVFSTPVHAAVITAAGNGNWNSTTNNAPWPNGIVPLSTDSVVIPSSRAVTVTTAATCAGVTVNSGATLSISNGITLTVNGDVAGTGTINTGTSTRTINISGNWTFTGTASGNGLVVVYNGTGTQTLTGSSVMSVTVNKASGELQLLSSKTIRTLLMTQGTFNPNGFLATISTFTFNGGTLIVPTSAWSGSYSRTTAPAAGTTVIYNRSGTQTVNGITYSNLTLSGGSAKTTTPHCNIRAAASRLRVTSSKRL